MVGNLMALGGGAAQQGLLGRHGTVPPNGKEGGSDAALPEQIQKTRHPQQVERIIIEVPLRNGKTIDRLDRPQAVQVHLDDNRRAAGNRFAFGYSFWSAAPSRKGTA
jgi:hypothetical protein